MEDDIVEYCDNTSPVNSTMPGPGNVELIPRPVRNRQRPAKYQDYETKFVRMLRKSRDKSDESPSPSTGRKRKVSFATNRIEIEPEMTEIDLENLTLENVEALPCRARSTTRLLDCSDFVEVLIRW